jgi:hypothetical protein
LLVDEPTGVSVRSARHWTSGEVDTGFVKVLALEHDVDGVEPAAFTAALLHAEAARLWELWRAGVLRDASFRTDRRAAVLVLEVTDVDAAATIVEDLPLVRAGLIHFELIGLRPYDGFVRLMGA